MVYIGLLINIITLYNDLRGTSYAIHCMMNTIRVYLDMLGIPYK